MRAYVPEGEIGSVRVGQKAFVFLDANERAVRRQGHRD